MTDISQLGSLTFVVHALHWFLYLILGTSSYVAVFSALYIDHSLVLEGGRLEVPWSETTPAVAQATRLISTKNMELICELLYFVLLNFMVKGFFFFLC